MKKSLSLIACIVVLSALLFLFMRQHAQTVNVTRECVTHTGLGMHIHPQLDIIIDGKKQVIPADIGIPTPDCMRPVHTHDDTGKIHVEWKTEKNFTLKDFFTVWDKPFNKNQILDSVADAEHVIHMTVNGKETDQYETLILKDLDIIVIEYYKK